jgi:hypothetical protein
MEGLSFVLSRSSPDAPITGKELRAIIEHIKREPGPRQKPGNNARRSKERKENDLVTF